MKLKLLLLLFSFTCLPVLASSGWQTDMEKALEEAKASNRYLLLNFTGSDWCGWCIKLDNEVFSKDVFKEYASKNLILVELDFPRKSPISDELKQQNQALMKKHGIRGFPTILVLDPSGNLLHRTGYKAGGPEAYVDLLKSIIDPHRESPGN
jgi:protein disulfide-isomerase